MTTTKRLTVVSNCRYRQNAEINDSYKETESRGECSTKRLKVEADDSFKKI